ncbi:MAG: trigger factor [Candidatus Omnitrophota bacterium]
MKVEIKKLDQLKRVLKIEVEGEVLNRDKEDIYREIGKLFKVPGFRPGGAPLDLVEKHHRSAFQQEFLKKALPSYYSKALADNSLEPVSTPRIYDVDFNDKGLIFSAEFEIKPQFEVEGKDYKNLKIKHKALAVEEIEVEKMITQLKDNVNKIVKRDCLDEELAKWAGYPSLEDLKNAIRAEILIGKLRARKSDMESFVLDELSRRIKIEAPRSLVKEQHDKLIQQETYNLRLRGVEEKDIKKYEDDISEKIKPLAERQVKLYYILEAIAQKESLAVNSQNIYETVIAYIFSCADYIV